MYGAFNESGEHGIAQNPNGPVSTFPDTLITNLMNIQQESAPKPQSNVGEVDMMIDDESDKNIIKPDLKPITVPQINIPTTQLFAPSLFSSNPFPPATSARPIVPPAFLAPPVEQQKENPFESVNGKYYVSIEYLL